MGVFATRSPNRPNSLGLSCVRLEKIDYTGKYSPTLTVSGADLLNGTPIYDIKPYLPYAESHPDARGGFSEKVKDNKLTVKFSAEIPDDITERQLSALCEVLSQDPRPQYQDDPGRIYGMSYLSYDVKFTVSENVLTVKEFK